MSPSFEQYRSIDLEKIWHFYYIYRLGSFKKAAEKCNVHENVIRHSIKTIEKKLGVELYETSKKNFVPTAFGKKYYQYACELREFTNAHFKDDDNIFDKPDNEIIILTSTTIANFVLPSVLKIFHANNPEVKIKVLSGPEYLREPIFHPYDLIIAGELTAPTLTKQHVADIQYYLYVSSELGKKMTHVQDIKDIKGFNFLMFSGNHLLDEQLLNKNNQLIQSNSYPFLLHCCHLGMGILSSFFDNATLERLGILVDIKKILPHYVSEKDVMYVYYSRYTDKKKFINQILEIIKKNQNKDNNNE